MPITYDIQRDGLYLRGLEQGIEQGIEQERYNAVANLLRAKVLSAQQIADILEVELKYVLNIRAKLEME